MLRLAEYASAVSGTGIYCAILAKNYQTQPTGSGVIDQPQALLVSGTIYCTAGAGLTAAGVVPVFLGPDGNYYPLAAASSPTAPGFVFNFQQTTPVPGLGIQVTSAPVGGTLFLAVIAAQL